MAWARAGRAEESVKALRRAFSVAHDAGARPNAGFTALALIEEHGEGRLSVFECHVTYLRADEALKDSEDEEDARRLRECARVVTRRLASRLVMPAGAKLPEVVASYERELVEYALTEERGSVTRAARRLGVSHQALIAMLKSRHRALAHLRTQPLPRKKALFRDQRRAS